ncbi:hypothetical protein KAX06_07030 [candidate division WOR-3 bacterium]|nr:hypothetical protein [candidate division WOR-3 bacterium]
MATEEEVKGYIRRFIEDKGGVHKDFCIGISTSPPTRLSQHGVREDDDSYYTYASTSEVARRVEQHFLDLGCKGGGGGGDEDSTGVYVYKRNDHTEP